MFFQVHVSSSIFYICLASVSSYLFLSMYISMRIRPFLCLHFMHVRVHPFLHLRFYTSVSVSMHPILHLLFMYVHCTMYIRFNTSVSLHPFPFLYIRFRFYASVSPPPLTISIHPPDSCLLIRFFACFSLPSYLRICFPTSLFSLSVSPQPLRGTTTRPNKR